MTSPGQQWIDRSAAARGEPRTWEVMARYFTADLHLGHRNIIEVSQRPFRDAAHMGTELVERWNSTVEPTDEVIVLGDFAMGRAAETPPNRSLLNGRKVLLAGNHDRCWHGHKKGVEASTDLYLEAGFDEIWQGSVGLRIGEVSVVACHFPYRGDSHDHDRYVAHRPWIRAPGSSTGMFIQSWKMRDRRSQRQVSAAWGLRAGGGDHAPRADDGATILTAHKVHGGPTHTRSRRFRRPDDNGAEGALKGVRVPVGGQIASSERSSVHAPPQSWRAPSFRRTNPVGNSVRSEKSLMTDDNDPVQVLGERTAAPRSFAVALGIEAPESFVDDERHARRYCHRDTDRGRLRATRDAELLASGNERDELLVRRRTVADEDIERRSVAIVVPFEGDLQRAARDMSERAVGIRLNARCGVRQKTTLELVLAEQSGKTLGDSRPLAEAASFLPSPRRGARCASVSRVCWSRATSRREMGLFASAALGRGSRERRLRGSDVLAANQLRDRASTLLCVAVTLVSLRLRPLAERECLRCIAERGERALSSSTTSTLRVRTADENVLGQALEAQVRLLKEVWRAFSAAQ